MFFKYKNKITFISSQNPYFLLGELAYGYLDITQLLGVKEEIILENRDNMKNTITSKFKNKNKLWHNKYLRTK